MEIKCSLRPRVISMTFRKRNTEPIEITLRKKLIPYKESIKFQGKVKGRQKVERRPKIFKKNVQCNI